MDRLRLMKFVDAVEMAKEMTAKTGTLYTAERSKPRTNALTSESRDARKKFGSWYCKRSGKPA